MDEWVRSHIEDVPRETAEFCGGLFKDARVLNVGCGEMLADFGLLKLRPKVIVGLDVNSQTIDWKDKLANRIRANGHAISDDYDDKLEFVQYDGREFPFEVGSFDAIISWSAFEHIDNMRAVLQEMSRVLVPDGKMFIQVYPWYFSVEGSHLTPWIKQPWFHLSERDGWVRQRLVDHAAKHGDEEFLLGHMYPEYVRLNRNSVSDLYREVRAAGLLVEKARLLVCDEDLSDAPDGVDFCDLMTRGSMMLIRKGGTRTALERSEQT